MSRILIVVSLLLGHGVSLLAQNISGTGPATSTGPIAQASRTAQQVVLDGNLHDAVWQTAPPLLEFVQHEPFGGEASSERTEIRFLYDNQALYVAAWMYDSDPSAIVQGEGRRDIDLANQDAVILVFDTFHDGQNAFVFGTTPAGIEYDGQVTKEGEGGFGNTNRGQQRGSGGGFNLNWDGSWEVRTSRDTLGWYAEFRIPFSTLRYPGQSRQEWGLNIARNIRRRNEQAFWAPVPRQYSLYRVSLAGVLEGVEAPAQRILRVTPYALGSVQRDYTTATPTDAASEFGADAKIGLGSSLTLDLTYNTDFAQVEVDEQQVNLTRFSTFFPEKRPFFLENAGTFSVGTPQTVELFFSRRIGIQNGRSVPILGGARLTGRAGNLQLGVLNIQTKSTDGAPGNGFSVARVFRELPNRSRIGALAVSRINTSDGADHNVTVAVDGRLGIGDAFSFDGYAARTFTPGKTGRESSFDISGTYRTTKWDAALAFRDVGDGFNPEVGFLSREAYQFVSGRILRRVRFPSVPWFRELRPHITYREFLDLEGFTTTRLIHFDSHFEFADGSFFQLPAINLTREGLREPFEIADGIFVPPGTYDNVEWGFAYNTNLSSPLSVRGRVTVGGFYTGHRFGTETSVDVRSGETFAASLRLTHDDVSLPQGDFTSLLTGLRLSYAFTPRVFVQSLIQFNNQTDQVSSNIRFGWLGTAGTGLFVVFNDLEQTGRNADPLGRGVIVKFARQLDIR